LRSPVRDLIDGLGIRQTIRTGHQSVAETPVIMGQQIYQPPWSIRKRRILRFYLPQPFDFNRKLQQVLRPLPATP